MLSLSMDTAGVCICSTCKHMNYVVYSSIHIHSNIDICSKNIVFGVRFLFGFWCSVRFSNLPNCSVFGSVSKIGVRSYTKLCSSKE